MHSAKPKKDDEISDDYDDDFDDLVDNVMMDDKPKGGDKYRDQSSERKLEDADQDDEEKDDWNLADDDWGDLDDMSDNNKLNMMGGGKSAKPTDDKLGDKKRQNLFFG